MFFVRLLCLMLVLGITSTVCAQQRDQWGRPISTYNSGFSRSYYPQTYQPQSNYAYGSQVQVNLNMGRTMAEVGPVPRYDIRPIKRWDPYTGNFGWFHPHTGRCVMMIPNVSPVMAATMGYPSGAKGYEQQLKEVGDALASSQKLINNLSSRLADASRPFRFKEVYGIWCDETKNGGLIALAPMDHVSLVMEDAAKKDPERIVMVDKFQTRLVTTVTVARTAGPKPPEDRDQPVNKIAVFEGHGLYVYANATYADSAKK